MQFIINANINLTLQFVHSFYDMQLKTINMKDYINQI